MSWVSTYSRVWVDKHLSDIFPYENRLKQGDDLSPLLLIFAWDYAIRRVHVNQDLKLNGTHQLLVYIHDVSMLGGSVLLKKKKKALVVASKGTSLKCWEN